MPELVGIVLAAGLGTRFEDGNKLLARVEGEPIVARAARSMVDASLDRTIATLGHDGSAVRRAVDPYVDETIQIDEYERGQSRSVRAGAQCARDADADAVLFLPGDMPCVDPATVHRLVDAYQSGSDGVIVPTYDDRRGNPVLFDAAHFDELASLSGDTGGRELFEDSSVRRVSTVDPGIHVDIDTRTDLWSVRQSGCDTDRS